MVRVTVACRKHGVTSAQTSSPLLQKASFDKQPLFEGADLQILAAARTMVGLKSKIVREQRWRGADGCSARTFNHSGHLSGPCAVYTLQHLSIANHRHHLHRLRCHSSTRIVLESGRSLRIPVKNSILGPSQEGEQVA